MSQPTTPKKILLPGVHERKELPLEESPELCQLKFSQAESLSTLANEYKLFTHGLLFTHGGWDRDPISDWLVEWQPEYAPVVIDLPSRFLLGMECRDERRRLRSEWCYKLLAIRQEGWDELFAFLSLVGAINRDAGYAARLLAQEVPIPDVVALERKAVLPTVCPLVSVVVFGVDSNKRAVYVEPAKSPPMDKPKVKVSPPDPETIDLMAKILSGDPEPYKKADIQFMNVKLESLHNIIDKTQKLII